MKNLLGGFYSRDASDLPMTDRYRYDPFFPSSILGFRLAKPTTTKSSNTGEDEQPDNPTTHLECT